MLRNWIGETRSVFIIEGWGVVQVIVVMILLILSRYRNWSSHSFGFGGTSHDYFNLLDHHRTQIFKTKINALLDFLAFMFAPGWSFRPSNTLTNEAPVSPWKSFTTQNQTKAALTFSSYHKQNHQRNRSLLFELPASLTPIRLMFSMNAHACVK